MSKVWECCVCKEPHLEIAWFRNPWGDIHMVCPEPAKCRSILKSRFLPEA